MKKTNEQNLNPETLKEKNYQDNLTIQNIYQKFGKKNFFLQSTKINSPVIWVNKKQILQILNFLKQNEKKPYNMLYDLHAIDERLRINKQHLPKTDFTIFYHLLSIPNNLDIIIKVALLENNLHIPTVTKIFPNANWYERETWEMFGIIFDNHPNLTHLIMPKNWQGYPLRKDHPARATEMEPFFLDKEKENLSMRNLNFNPKEWGMSKKTKNENFMFLNLGPNHPSVHGVFRIILQLKGEEIINCVPDIGYHHRGAEKMGERQSWHNYIPYTDRVEYLGGCINEMPYILAVEKLANIKVPNRVKVIRIMLSELFRINSHLLYISTYIQDVGGMTPVFLAFTDRQKIYNVIEGITGARMHPAWFRIGGVANDLPNGWNKLLQECLLWIPKRLNKYVKLSIKNSIFQARTKGVASYNFKEALKWGVTGSALRATGINFDIRKKRPYSYYENFEFEIPIGKGISDCYSRIIIKIEEIYQSLRILEQCLKNMPSGPYKADHPLTTPPLKHHTTKNIETLITHFLQVSWGPVIPANESFQMIEATKGINSYYLISDGSTMSYRTRIRTPSFPHLQQIPSVIKGSILSDLITYLGSIDFVMSDVDR
ncbi:NADH-quinone oxidoreductase subunit C/D [Candidatus Westeberhardia cardiocondylae]|uniref:NADH-quinone oxidoreductase subunit C/D n=1 Tax=Candidatus Westeberhardia cardiocondylae TaxID=1594731 RepID=A0A0H5BX28_9ENTR|nr:NADH-quinone oxidoreductase subunit C/D [Candidatus Westeberhardia cardiocondylae]CEN32320.1 NADH-quinone oxidoreductase subunit C/D [Candidatus Westeberhardia cardiocondylae]